MVRLVFVGWSFLVSQLADKTRAAEGFRQRGGDGTREGKQTSHLDCSLGREKKVKNCPHPYRKIFRKKKVLKRTRPTERDLAYYSQSHKGRLKGTSHKERERTNHAELGRGPVPALKDKGQDSP